MKKQFLFLFLCFFTGSLFAQKVTLSGVVSDGENAEPLIGATVTAGSAGVVTDFDGNYEILLEPGTHTLNISYVSYKALQVEINLTADQVMNFELVVENILTEVVVTGDIAIARETPVAFSNIPTIKLEEELAAQDIPMILNSTPGAYATQSGGGDGDARITIRGFNQRNVAVMLDGIPVNDMENGWVYWSNWFGLDLVTQTMQVQRGLGASKLSIPSIGGTINILTKGIDAKRGLKFKQEVGNNGFLRSTLGLTSGRLKNGWGISAAASYKTGNGWVDGTFTEGYFYYLRIDKQLGNHRVSLTGFGAPQEHGQRPFTADIGQIDTTIAKKLGVSKEAIGKLIFKNKGRRFNSHWGYRDGEVFNTRKNYYHKPQFNLRHNWQASDRFYWSNIAYLSIGKGGGTARDGNEFERTEDDIMDFEKTIENGNTVSAFNQIGKSNTFIRASNNDHFWYGLLSTLEYNISEQLTLSGGVDARYYRGDHYRSIYDLLGGNGAVGEGNLRIEQNQGQDAASLLQVGDKTEFDNSGFVRWGGLFGLLEYKREKWSAFVNVSTAMSSYALEDYMKAKEIKLPDTTLYVGFSDTLSYGDQTYTLDSPEAQDQRIDWINIPSYTFKVGAAYKLDETQSVFFNTGYISKAQRFGNVINNRRTQPSEPIVAFFNYDNEKILAFELGYNYKSRKFSANLNSYYTLWENKPLESAPTIPLTDDNDSDRIPVNLSGIDALHKGIELDFVYQPFEKLSIEGLASIGDWIWNSSEVALVELPDSTYEFPFDAKGVHVGDAAQLQFGGLIRYEPIKNLYFKVNVTHFAKNFANFQPEDLRGDDGGRESWQLPNYTVVNGHAGYYFKVKNIGLNIRANVLNLLDETYITDARNNDRFNSSGKSDFDAESATVHFAQGRRYTLSLQISL